MQVTLKKALHVESLEVMNFLNEVVSRYPDAISLAPGRPWEDFFGVESAVAGIARYAERMAGGGELSQSFNSLGQYGKTNGIVLERVAEHLRRDCSIDVPADAIMLTSGCQEAMLVALLGLFEPATDVLLSSDPTYIGITGLATILGIEIVSIPTGPNGLEPDLVAHTVKSILRRGKRPRALYDIPDFNNPLGTSMPVAARKRLLEVAREHDLVIFEDNPYGLLAYDAAPLPPLKALDESSVVIYLGSFSKTLFPGLRLGYLVGDQSVEGAPATYLAQALSRVKSLTTVNTATLSQAALDQILLDQGGSLGELVARKVSFYRSNRDCMMAALERSFAPLRERVAKNRLGWNRPEGGFFVTVQLPDVFGAEQATMCARDYGVICCPMSFFSLRGERGDQARLSFSYVTPAQIEEGVARLAAFVVERMVP